MVARPNNAQVTMVHRRKPLATRLRALIPATLASALVAGCSAPMERHAPTSGAPGGDSSRVVTGQAYQFAGEVQQSDLAIDGADRHADAFRCLSRPADCRVRDLRTPWEARRYLMPDGTLSAPPVPGAPR